jgi:hypothetical protein
MQTFLCDFEQVMMIDETGRPLYNLGIHFK